MGGAHLTALLFFLTITNYALANEVVINTNSLGAGSLLQAIADANPGDTVTFNASLDNATITGLGITISKDITIDASDLPNGITLVGFGAGPVFNVSSGTVTFRGLTITNPSIDDNFTVGGISNSDITTIENCYFTNIGTGGGPTLTAGVYNEDGASLTLINTSFSNIIGVSGIRNEGSLVMRNVTLNNVNTDQGGGGLDVILNTATGSVTANHITIYDNIGVAIRNQAPREDFNINFSIVDDNFDNGGEATAYGNGLEGDRNVFGDFPVDITGTGNFQANPGNTDLFISDIADNGGPVPTCAIAIGSQAIDFASNSTFAQDAQGFYLNGTRDAGAFEFNAIKTFTPFVTRWSTPSDGEITIPTIGGGYAYDITWTNITGTGGDGSETNVGSGDYMISGLNSGDTYRVEISGNFPRIYFNDGSNSPVPGSNSSKILTIEQWGDIAWESMGSAFRGCSNLTYNAADNPDLSIVTDMTSMFDGASSFNGDIASWDVSTIITMQRMFDGASAFNQDISGWTVTLVENFNRTFASADAFNQPLDAWDVGGATDMTRMFAFTDLFDQPLDGWGAKLNGVTSMEGMFEGARVYDQDLNSWDVSTVLNFDRMFRTAAMFNGNISSWTLTAADDMSQMFTGALAFNSDITGWNVSNVTNMSGMFTSTAAFNQDISGWDVSNVTDMGEEVSDPTEDGMFRNAVAFDQDLSTWDISSVTDMAEIFDGSGMSQENYDATLVGWSTLDGGETQIPTGITLGADGINYCDPTGRDALTNAPNNWTINDAGKQCPPPIAYYSFNGNANDESGNGNDGTESGGVALSTDRFGTADAAYNFDGTDGLISVPTSTSLESPITDITISAWVNIESFPTNNQAPVLTKGTVNEQYGLMLSSDGFWILAGIGGSNLGTPSLDQWTMATITYSANTISFYENGVFLGSLSGQINPPVVSEPLEIGANKPGDVEYFDGSIDDIRIYDRALSQSEIVELYAESNWLQVSPDAFVTTWETTSPGETIILPLTDGSGFGQNYTYDFIIDWGDGTVEHNTSTDLSHTYATPGTHQVAITGTFPFMSFNASGKNGSIDKLMSIEQWGDIEWASLSLAFYNCTNLVVNATDAPDLSNLTTTDMTFTFGNTAIVDGVGHWEMSTVTGLSFMFYQSPNFNEDLGGWDISNITDMSDMLVDVGMSTDNYDATITGWATLEAGESAIPTGVTLTATDLTYCASEADRQSLIDGPNNWAITDAGIDCLENGLIAYYPFTGNANDESGNGNDGTWDNDEVYVADRFGNGTSAASFDGVNDFINLGNPSSLNILGDMSITAWIRTDKSDRQHIFSRAEEGETIDENRNSFRLNATNFLNYNYEHGAGINVNVSSTDRIIVGEWTQISFTRSVSSSTEIKVYINGILQGTTSGLINPDGGTSAGMLAIIGETNETISTFFDGLIDDIRIYDRALDPSEITDLYTEGGWPLVTTPSLYAVHPHAATPGEQVQVYGKHFEGSGLTVAIGGSTATVDSVKHNIIYAKVPNTAYGLVDITVTNDAGSTAPLDFTVIRENHGGYFSGEVQVASTAIQPLHVYAYDVDQDGDMDVLTASASDDKIAWHENDGNQNFTERNISTNANFALSVFAIDIDGDTDIDVLSASGSDDKIAWYENDGSHGFTERVITISADNAQFAYAADIDGDGDIDVLSASANDNKIAWYENDGSQGFTERTISTNATGAISVIARDVDGDGDMDVLSASAGDDKIAWYENDGSQVFTERAISTNATGARIVHADDVDGDGDLDVLSASGTANKIAWYENNGSQSFTERVISTNANTARYVHSADLDGDGDIDVLSASLNDNKVAWYENDGSQVFTERVISTSANGARSVYPADLDGDGDMDVLTTAASGNRVYWYQNSAGELALYPFNGNANDESGNGNDGVNSGVTFTTDRFGTANAAASFDGSSSILVPPMGNNQSFAVSLWYKTTSGGHIIASDDGFSMFADPVGDRFGTNWINSVGLYDVGGAPAYFDETWHHVVATHDGDNETIVVYYDGEVFHNRPNSGTFNGNLTDLFFGITRNTSQAPGLGNFSGVADDILIYDRAITQEEVTYLYTEGGWPFITSVQSFSPMSTTPGSSLTITGTNFDPTPSNNIVYFGGAKAEVTAASETELTVTVPKGATYDYISVLTDEQIAYSPLKFAPSMPASFTLDANSFAAPVNITGVNAPRSLRFADLDGDDKLDMATVSQTDNQVAVFRNTATPGVLNATSFESANTRASGGNAVWLDFADLDRDGKLDLISNHASGGGSIGLYRNNTSMGSFNAGSFDARVDISLNRLGEEVVIGDLDLDGQPDIVTTSNLSSLFQVLQNTTTVGVLNSGSFSAAQDFNSGADNIAIAIGDLDGDGLPDVVTGNRGDFTITTMLNETSGSSLSFGSPSSKTAGANPWGLELADIDGDGKLDIIASSQDDNELYLYHNSSSPGSVSFGGPETFSLPSGPFQLELGDLSGDGLPEIVVASTGGGISVFQNQSSSGTINAGSLGARIDYVSNNGVLLDIGDLDGDGANDIAVTSYVDGSISLLRNTLLDGPLAQYDFIAGSTADLSGYGFDATANGGPAQTQDRFLNANQAYSFDGNDDNMLASSFDAEPGTITAVNWFKFPEGGAGGTRQMIDIEGVGALALVDQQLIGVLRINGGFSTPLHPVTLSPELWYMAALTFDGNDLDLYLNGELVASNADAGTIDLTGGTNNVIIGTNFDGTLNFNGEMDDLKIYGRALDATEILELYNTDGWDVTNINEFSLVDQYQEAVIDTIANTVDIVTLFGTDLTNLTPTFRLSPQATARVASTPQISGATANDFTNPVTYEITSSDGLTVENWTVTVTVDNGLIVDMPFNGDATDISGKGNNGTLQGPTATADRFGDVSSAYSFDGNDQINTPNNANLQLTDHITLSAWVKLNETTDDQAIIHKGEDGFIDYLLNVFGTGRPSPGVVEFGSQTFPQFVEGVTRVDDGREHHILGTYDGSALSIYVDGVLDNTQAASGNLFVGDGPLNIGAFATLPSTARFANGIIDDVMIFSRSLDATEVRDLYNDRGWDVTNINEFSFAEQVAEAEIDTATNTVDIILAFGKDPSSLIPTFRLSTGATARISGAVQTSGATANDYTNPVTYAITSADGLTVENWTITAAVDNGIVVDLPFAGDALDQSGKGNHGTVNGGAALTEDRFSVADNAYLFDGTDDFIDVSGATSTEFSASFWFKANTITTENNSPDLQSIYYLYNEEGGNTAHSTTRLKASKIDVVQLRQESPNAFESYSEAFDDVVRWHHMVVTGSATQPTTIYVDNQLQYTGQMGFTGWTDLVLGYSRFSGGTDYFDGAIDDVKVFSYVIDEIQVDELYRENGWPLLSEETDIITFSVPGQTGDALIDTDLHTVDVEVQFGTDPTSLIATYELSDGATATISTIDQTSDVSVNDFTNPLVYQVLAEDQFTTQGWLVSVTILPDMIAYYPFNGNANDASGNGNNGTPTGGVTLTEDRFGNPDRAYSFDGADDEISLVPSNELESTSGLLSVSAWVKNNAINDIFVISNFEGGTNWMAGDLSFGYSNATSRLSVLIGKGTSLAVLYESEDINLTPDAWHHIAFTYDENRSSGDKIRTFLDGQSLSTSINSGFESPGTTILNSTEILKIGSQGTSYSDGSIDDIRIYGRALTQPEITNLYTEGGWPLTPDGTESILARQGTGGIEADGVTYETLTVQVKDETGRDIPTAGIAVQFTATEGTTDDATDLFTDPSSIVADASGSMTVMTDATGLATVRLANSEIEQLAVIAQIDTDDDGVVDATVSGSPTPLLIDYTIGEPSITTTGSEISSAGPSTVADGSSSIAVSVQLKDVSGREVNQAGIGIQFTTTGSALLSGAAGSTTVMTNGLGQASVEVTNNIIETITVRALIDVNSINSFEDPLELVTAGGTGSGVVQIVFTPDPTSALLSDVAILQVNKADGLDIELQSDETGTIYWIINLTGVFPDAAAVKSASAATNGSGSFNISTADVLVQQSIAGTSLADAERYQLYLVHEDVNGNFSIVENLSWTADSAAPEISSATIDPATPTTVSLVFTEELVFDVVAGITLTDDDGAVVPFSSGATGPTLNFGLTLSSAITDSDTLYVNYDAASGSFADIATNPLGSFVEKIPLNSGGITDVTLDLALVQINQTNGVTISHTSSTTGKLKWLIQDNSTPPILAAFDGENTGGFGIDSITVSSTNAVESIIQANGLTHGATYYLFAIAEDATGEPSAIQSISWMADGIAPEINSATVAANSPSTVAITLSEDVSATVINGLTVTDATGASISTAGFTLVNPTLLEVVLSRQIVESDVLTLSYIPTGNEIVDAAFNSLMAVTDLAITNNVVTVPPVLTNVEITNVTGVESIDISYQVNKAGSVYWIAAPTGGSFTTAQIKAGTGNNSGFSSFEIGNVDELLSQTIAPLILANNEMFDIHLFAEDEAGVASAIEIRTWEADGKAPSMISASVVNATPSQITLVFDEALVYDNLEGFSLEFIGSRLALRSVEALDDLTLALNLNGSLIQSDRVLLSYSPTDGSLRDSFGNIVRIIEDFEVDIDILDPPADLSNLEIVGIDELVSIDLQYQSTKTGKMYWVMTNSAAIPTEIELKTGGSDNFGSGVFDITVVDEPVIETLLAEGLQYLTAYYVHIAQEDDDGNLSATSSLPWITPKGPPTIDPIAVLNIESLQVDLQYSSSSEESLVIHYAIYNEEQPDITTAAILNGIVTNDGDAIQFASFDANLNGEHLELIVFTNELSSIEHFVYAFGVNENDVGSEIASATWLPVRESGTDPLIRNLITPNGDGQNDRLYIENLELYPGAHTVTLTERNGKPVITINDFDNDDISVSDDFERLEPGAYICVLVLADGTKFMESITILKQ